MNKTRLTLDRFDFTRYFTLNPNPPTPNPVIKSSHHRPAPDRSEDRSIHPLII
jgi:hypothetical protein